MILSFRSKIHRTPEFSRCPLTKEEEDRAELLKFYRKKQEEEEERRIEELKEEELRKMHVSRVAILRQKFDN